MENPTWHFKEISEQTPKFEKDKRRDWENPSCFKCEGKFQSHEAHHCIYPIASHMDAIKCENYSPPWKGHGLNVPKQKEK